MILKKTRSHRFNMGNYEHVDLFVTAEVDTNNDAEALTKLGIQPDDYVGIEDFLDERIGSLIASDIDMVMATTDKEESHVFPLYEYSERNSNTTNK